MNNIFRYTDKCIEEQMYEEEKRKKTEKWKRIEDSD